MFFVLWILGSRGSLLEVILGCLSLQDGTATVQSPGSPPRWILEDPPAKILVCFEIPFSAFGANFPSWGASEAEHWCFFRSLGLRSHFGTISGQILGCLGLQKRGYRVRGIAKTTFSPSSDFGRLWSPF